jgi:hypothetical protein
MISSILIGGYILSTNTMARIDTHMQPGDGAGQRQPECGEFTFPGLSWA